MHLAAVSLLLLSMAPPTSSAKNLDDLRAEVQRLATAPQHWPVNDAAHAHAMGAAARKLSDAHAAIQKALAHFAETSTSLGARVCALQLSGDAYLAFDRQLRAAPPPSSLSPELLAVYREHIDDGDTFTDLGAVPAWRAAVAYAEANGVVNECAAHARAALIAQGVHP